MSTVPLVNPSIIKVWIIVLPYKLTPSFAEILSGFNVDFYATIYVCCFFLIYHFYKIASVLIPDIGQAVSVFANGPGDLGSIPGRVVPKTQKMVLEASLLNTQHYKVRIKGKVEQSWEGVAPSPTPWCSSYRKGSPRVTLDYGRQLYFTYWYKVFFVYCCCFCFFYICRYIFFWRIVSLFCDFRLIFSSSMKF